MYTYYTYRVTFIGDSGHTVVRTVEARHEFEAVQLASAFGRFIISVVNCDL